MSKIIQFPDKSDIDWKRTEELIESDLANVIPEVRDTIKYEILSLLKHYAKYDQKLSLEFPETTTDKQIKAMSDAFDNRNNLIKEMLADLVKTKTELCIEQYKNS